MYMHIHAYIHLPLTDFTMIVGVKPVSGKIIYINLIHNHLNEINLVYNELFLLLKTRERLNFISYEL